MPKVSVIKATINPLTHMPNQGRQKRRVCGYARVSTDSDEQFTSFQAQQEYYTKFIQSHPDWEFAGLYSDEGISGTNTKKRDGFNQMIKDALDGKIDLIVTKSISRFARNTVDTLLTVRKLKEKGVECYFEKENIFTFDSKGEMVLTLMSSLAQEESRSISENVTWGHRQSFRNGKVHIAYSRFLGFEKGEDGKLKVVPEEANIIRRIYGMFLDGFTATKIAAILNEEGIESPGKAKKGWTPTTLMGILTNEKYKGDALLQKSFTVDFLSHKSKKNEGEVEQYYVTNSHEAIIEPNEWDFVQMEIERRRKIGSSYSCNSEFSCRLRCGDCGGFYGPKTWHSQDKYKKTVWQCNDKFKNKRKCETPTLLVDDIKTAFVKAYNQFAKSKIKVIEKCLTIYNKVSDTSDLDLQIDEQFNVMEGLNLKAKQMIDENASEEQSQEEYKKKYSAIENQYSKAEEKYNELLKAKKLKETEAKSMLNFAETFKNTPDAIFEWNYKLWNYCIDFATVNKNKSIDFLFKNGQVINVLL